MILKPDYSTAAAAPWTADKTVQVIHDAYDQKNRPIPMAPRNVLKRVVELYRKKGWEPVVAPEMEFYLVARNIDPGKPIEAMMGRTGRPAAARQAYSMSAVDEYGPVIDDIYDFAEAQGLEIDGITQEGGAGQLEINLRHGDPVKLADEIFYFKRLIREAAHRHDCFATFMAKPIQDEPGSAMHIHHSVIDLGTGQNIFSTLDGAETPAFLHFIGGMQRNLPEVVAIMAPYVNSYRRYVRDHAAPINLEWGPRQPHHRHADPDLGPGKRAVWKTGWRGWTATLTSRSPPRLPAAIWAVIEEWAGAFKGDAYTDGDAPDTDEPTSPVLAACPTRWATVLLDREKANTRNASGHQPLGREHLLLHV